LDFNDLQHCVLARDGPHRVFVEMLTLENFGWELEIVRDLRDLLLCIVQISSGFLCSFHSFREIDTCAFEATLCVSLQFREFTLFGVELARSVKCISRDFDSFNPGAAAALGLGREQKEP
jgi:hypothetical protein